MVVGALIFVLGIDLVKEALWDNRHRASWSEYITIVSIMITMTVWDFVIGVLFGIIVCCTLYRLLLLLRGEYNSHPPKKNSFQVSFSSCRTRSYGAYEPSTLAITRCRPCGGRACSVRILGRFQGKQLFFVYKV